MASMKHIAVVLVSPKEEGNVGAVARVMANMGAERLVLVAPRCEVGQKALARACEGAMILERAERFNTVAEAATHFQTLAATTARVGQDREPIITPRQLAAEILKDGSGEIKSGEERRDSSSRSVAILFGPEEAGLDNAALQLCHHVIRIPTVPGSSLNLSHAVALALYDLRCAFTESQSEIATATSDPATVSISPDPSDPSDHPAPNAAIESFLTELRAAARLIDDMYSHNEAARLWQWRRLLHRARPTNSDLWMLRGFIRQIRAMSKGAAPHDSES